MKKLEHKTVFITGGLSGIGKACAIAAAREGANIAVADMKSVAEILDLKAYNFPIFEDKLKAQKDPSIEIIGKRGSKQKA